MIAGIDTLTAVTASLSLGPKSRIDCKCGERVLRYIGIEVIEAMPLTLKFSRARSHRVKNAGGPATTISAAPDSIGR